MWVTFRLSLMLYRRVKNQWNGKEDLIYSLYNDWQYDDWHRDVEDMKAVNYRYSDHRDRDAKFGFWTHMTFKPHSDYANSAIKFYRKGSDSYFDYFFGSLFK